MKMDCLGVVVVFFLMAAAAAVLVVNGNPVAGLHVALVAAKR
jgi:hypothetical protein